MSTYESPRGSPCGTPRLHPADFDGPPGDTEPEAAHSETSNRHWTFQKMIDPSKFLTLFGRLPHKLLAINYISWMFTAEATLDTIDLLGYVNGEIPVFGHSHKDYPHWRAANALVRSILVTNMSEEVAVQMSHLQIASEIWSEAKRLFSGQTMTD